MKSGEKSQPNFCRSPAVLLRSNLTFVLRMNPLPLSFQVLVPECGAFRQNAFVKPLPHREGEVISSVDDDQVFITGRHMFVRLGTPFRRFTANSTITRAAHG